MTGHSRRSEGNGNKHKKNGQKLLLLLLFWNECYYGFGRRRNVSILFYIWHLFISASLKERNRGEKKKENERSRRTWQLSPMCCFSLFFSPIHIGDCLLFHRSIKITDIRARVRYIDHPTHTQKKKKLLYIATRSRARSVLRMWRAK